MGVGISSLAKITGSVTGAAMALGSIASGLDKASTDNKDKEMMDIANKEAQKKIEAKAEQNRITMERIEEIKTRAIEEAAEANKITIGGNE